MQLPELSGFSLVGGTALALKFGHRNSIDLDLFSETDFDHDALHATLQSAFQRSFSYAGTRSRWGVFCMIEGVKVDIVYFPHKRVQPVEQYDEIRMYGDEDLMAMKVNAILRRGKKKDFWDICELLKQYSMQQSRHSERSPSFRAQRGISSLTTIRVGRSRNGISSLRSE
jgi:hypothetical protein